MQIPGMGRVAQLFEPLGAGLGSLSADAMRNKFVESQAAKAMESSAAGMSAQDLAANYGSLQQGSKDFVSNFNTAYQPKTYNGLDSIQYGAGRGLGMLGNATNSALNSPLGQVAAFTALPVAMSGLTAQSQDGQQQQMTQDQYQQMMMQRQMQSQQNGY